MLDSKIPVVLLSVQDVFYYIRGAPSPAPRSRRRGSRFPRTPPGARRHPGPSLGLLGTRGSGRRRMRTRVALADGTPRLERASSPLPAALVRHSDRRYEPRSRLARARRARLLRPNCARERRPARAGAAAAPNMPSVVEYGARRALVVGAVMLAALMQLADTTIVNVALPTIDGALGRVGRSRRVVHHRLHHRERHRHPALAVAADAARPQELLRALDRRLHA